MKHRCEFRDKDFEAQDCYLGDDTDRCWVAAEGEYGGAYLCCFHMPDEQVAELDSNLRSKTLISLLDDWNSSCKRKLSTFTLPHLRGGGFDFSNYHFLSRINLRNSRIDNARFNKCKFHDDACFQDATFNGAQFEMVEFAGNALFSHCEFLGDVSFSEAVFKEDADYRDASFAKSARFSKSKFNSGARFIRANFSSNARFSEAVFSENARFSEASFRKDASFDKTIFGGHTWFTGITVDGLACYKEAKFKKYLRFNGATVGNDVGFEKARFGEYAWFNETEFRGNAGFKEARFSGLASFKKCGFGQNADFSDATFNGYSEFLNVRFGGETRFNKAEFNDKVKFENTLFDGETSFELSLFQARLSMVKNTFVWAPSFENSELRDGVNFYKTIFVDKTSPKAPQHYRVLKKLMKSISYKREERHFHVLEQESIYCQAETGWAKKMILLCYHWFTSFGLSYTRPLYTLLAVVLLSPIIFEVSANLLTGNIENIGEYAKLGFSELLEHYKLMMAFTIDNIAAPLEVWSTGSTISGMEQFSWDPRILWPQIAIKVLASTQIVICLVLIAFSVLAFIRKCRAK